MAQGDNLPTTCCGAYSVSVQVAGGPGLCLRNITCKRYESSVEGGMCTLGIEAPQLGCHFASTSKAKFKLKGNYPSRSQSGTDSVSAIPFDAIADIEKSESPSRS